MELIKDEFLGPVGGGSVLTVSVHQGDTLGALAKRFDCTVEDICRWNNIDNPDLITVGQKLIFKF